MGAFSMDPVEVHNAAKEFRRLSENYTEVYTSLMNSASTMGEAWDSADNLAFVDQIKGLCDDLKAMTDHLNICAEALDKQASNVEEVRDYNKTNVRKLVN